MTLIVGTWRFRKKKTFQTNNLVLRHFKNGARGNGNSHLLTRMPFEHSFQRQLTKYHTFSINSMKLWILSLRPKICTDQVDCYSCKKNSSWFPESDDFCEFETTFMSIESSLRLSHFPFWSINSFEREILFEFYQLFQWDEFSLSYIHLREVKRKNPISCLIINRLFEWISVICLQKFRHRLDLKSLELILGFDDTYKVKPFEMFESK